MRKRKIAAILLLMGLLLTGLMGPTNGSRSASGQELARAGQAEFQGRELADLESTRAEQERSALGLAMAPVPLQAGFGRTRFLIGLGSYLVNTGCVGCHTAPQYAVGGNPFMGQPEKVNATNYLAGGVRFGPFVSRNLTPDPKRDNLPAGLRLEEFIRTMRTGEDLKKIHPQLGPFLQVMPWPELGKLSDRDLEAIYAYLNAIPHAEPTAPMQ